jgi:tRNA(fMet)-specific endonuclease VapC
VKLVKQDYIYCISAVTEYEIYTGTTLAQEEFWKKFLKKTNVLPFDKKVVEVAVKINRDLKKKRKLIDIADLFIGATALAHSIPIVTLNESHFSRIDNLKLVY